MPPSVSAQVVGVEKVTMPAGTVEATKLEVGHNSDGTRGRLTFWYAPAAHRMVKARPRWKPGLRRCI